MLKKKNIAMMTAIAAVATSVAPVAAAGLETQYLNEDTLVTEVQNLLDTKYSNPKETGDEQQPTVTVNMTNCVYNIVAVQDGTTSHTITNIDQLKSLIETVKVSGESLEVKVVDKGHRTEGNYIVATEENDYVKYAETTSGALTTAAVVGTTTVGGTNIIKSVTTTKTVDEKTAVELTLANEKTILVRPDDYKLDMNKPVDANGNVVSPDATGDIAKTVVGFKKVETGKIVENDMPGKEVANFQYRENGATIMNLSLSELQDENGYTQKGADLLNLLIDANKSGNSTATVNKDGNKYNVEFDHEGTTTGDLTEVTSNEDGGYSFEIQLKVEKASKASRASLKADRNVLIKVSGDVEKELNAFRNAATGTTSVTVGTDAIYNKLAGDSRFETAVEISKASYDAHDKKTTDSTVRPNQITTASSVVLVGESAIVDGLAAAPLAKLNDAPILFAKKDVVTEETMNEIKRVVKKGSDIYIVGGEDVISKDVEKQLVQEMNANIIRLAGDDRNETSIAIAEHMAKSTTVGTAYIVGGDGEADAMSIASVAARETTGTTVSPIIVTPANGLTKDAKAFLQLENVTTAAVIGGEAKISTQVMKDLSDLTIAANRIAGNDRHLTNAAVINEFYTTTGASATTTNTVYVAKDGYVGGNDKLIDALAVAPLAGRNNAPIVLATESVLEKQKTAIEAATNGASSKKLLQVGHGIASSLMDTVAKVLKLK